MSGVAEGNDMAHGAVGTFRSVVASRHAMNTLQPLNELSDKMKPSSSNKTNIRLSIGDPTVDGNLKVPSCVIDTLVEVVKSGEYNGYPPTIGYDDSRKTVAEYWKRFCQSEERKSYITWENVIMTSGASQAIEFVMTTLCNEGDNILVCAPAFPLYKTLCDRLGVECRYYPLDADNKWHCDLDFAGRVVDDRTKGFVMINPSNPCGSNFSREHVGEIIKFCEKHQLPLLSDEIYAELVFPGRTFTSVADFDTVVPRVVVGGTAKCHAAPGWRLGWTILIDPARVAKEVQVGMERLAQVICGPNSLCQEALTRSLLHCPASHTEDIVQQLQRGSKVYSRLLDHDVGLSFDKPEASMFVMIKVNFNYYKDIQNDMEFYEKLLDEENVQVLPGEIFGMGGFVRATTSRPPAILEDAVERIISFCERHKKE